MIVTTQLGIGMLPSVQILQVQLQGMKNAVRTKCTLQVCNGGPQSLPRYSLIDTPDDVIFEWLNSLHLSSVVLTFPPRKKYWWVACNMNTEHWTRLVPNSPVPNKHKTSTYPLSSAVLRLFFALWGNYVGAAWFTMLDCDF